MAWTYYRGCRRLANPHEAAIRLSAERADRITCKASGSDGITSTTGLRARRIRTRRARRPVVLVESNLPLAGRSAMSLFAAVVSPPLWVFTITVVTCGMLLRNRHLVTETTLMGPWLWMLGSISVMGGTHLVALFASSPSAGQSPNWCVASTFAAAASSFCPLMSLLGAKRPQDRGWHFVVISLWAILVLPVAESLLLRRGQMPDVQGARSWFMLILIGLGMVNSLPTRFWFPAILFGGGQLLMLANSVPFLREWVDASPTIFGFTCCCAACMITAQLASRSRRRQGSLTGVWRDFRDSFGLLWGLRVAEQINIAARTSGWPLALRWSGFVDEQGNSLDASSLPVDTQKSLHQVMQNLLRRFVSSDWIAARMENAIDLEAD
ncbi:MAG TPA: hypothetical protein P5307_11375 [Pirellulaceae bacterium]|nr:hypothetical protein [Pirellulaceae bacterium]